MAYLYGEKEMSGEANRIVHCLKEKITKESARLRMKVALDPAPPMEAARRLALTDMKFYPQAREIIDESISAGGPFYSRKWGSSLQA